MGRATSARASAFADLVGALVPSNGSTFVHPGAMAAVAAEGQARGGGHGHGEALLGSIGDGGRTTRPAQPDRGAEQHPRPEANEGITTT